MKKTYLFCFASLLFAFSGCEFEGLDGRLESARVAVIDHECGLALQAEDNALLYAHQYPDGLELATGKTFEIKFEADPEESQLGFDNMEECEDDFGAEDNASPMLYRSCFERASFLRINIREFIDLTTTDETR